jgi:hypothetical protein
MRYAVAGILVLVIGTSAMVQGALAAEKDTPQTAGLGVVAQYGSSGSGMADPGAVAGPMAPWFHAPIIEHDSGARN